MRYFVDSAFIEVLVRIARSEPMGLHSADPAWLEYIAHLCSKSHISPTPQSIEEQRQRSVAYAIGFLPRYLPRVREALWSAGLALDGLVRCVGPKITVLDIGCGPGTCSVAILQELQRVASANERNITVRIYGRDRNVAHLETAGRLISRATDAGIWPRLQVEWFPEKADLFDSPTEPSEIAVFGHSLCEKYQATPAQLDHLFVEVLNMLRKTLKPRGVGIIIEPPLVSKSWVAIHLREFLADQPEFSIVGPCPRTRSGCPEMMKQETQRHCRAVTVPVVWDARDTSGAALLEIMSAAGFARREGCLGLVQGSGHRAFFALVLAKGQRPNTPPWVGTTVARKGSGLHINVCSTDEDDNLRLTKVSRPESGPETNVRFQTVRIGAQTPLADGKVKAELIDWNLSALYKDGWV